MAAVSGSASPQGGDGGAPRRGADAAKDSKYPTRVLLCVTAVALLVNSVETMVIPGVLFI